MEITIQDTVSACITELRKYYSSEACIINDMVHIYSPLLHFCKRKGIIFSYYPYKTNRSKSNHINLIKNLSTFIVFLGDKAFIPDEEYNFKTETYTPLTLSTKQISKLIEGIDKENNITYSVLFRLLYCCGLRPGEAVRLERNDFDTKSGDLYIKESKNYKDRHIVVSDQIRFLCEQYDYASLSEYIYGT